MKPKKRLNPIIYTLLLALVVSFSWAQEVPEVDIPSDMNADIPVDASIKTGKLDNGLTYIIRKNAKPEERVELRLVVNAGSLMEDDDQLGLAHFTEHMAFNGTENFEKNELIDVLQLAGVKFGAHLNAYTSFDETVYMLKVPTADTTLEKSMQILEDWASAITFEEDEIDKERGIVIEEWRMRLSPQQRMQEEYLPKLLADSRYAQRLPIGTKEILENFDYSTLERFYEDWYRPDEMAVIAVGDIDVQQMEADIKRRFSKLQAPANVREREIYEVPDHQDVKVSVVSDKEYSFNVIQLFFKQPGIVEAESTLTDFREMYKQSLFTGMLSQRLAELTQQAEPPFIQAYSYYGNVVVRVKEGLQQTAVVPEGGLQQGLKTLLEENEKVKRFGFTQSELDRYKARMLTSYEAAYKEREKTDSRRYASEYVRMFLEDEPVPGIAFEFAFAQQVMPEITLEEVNALANDWMGEGNMVVVMMAPEKEGVTIPTEAEVRALLQEMENAEVEAYEDEAIASTLIENVPAPAEITAEKTIDEIGVTELTLANGVKVVLKPTEFKDDEILMRAASPGGYSVFSDEEYYSAVFADGIVQQGGIKDFSAIALNKFLSDKNANVSPYINALEEGFSGSAAPKDFETMLQMTHLYFTAPRQDQESFQSFVSKNKSLYQNLMSNPQYYYQDQMIRIMTQNHPRGGGFPTQEDFDKIDFEVVYDTYQDRFADASDFTFFFVGNLDVEAMKPKIASYLGSLPASGRTESWEDQGIRPPSGVVKESIYKGTDPKSMVNITFTGEMEYDREEAYELNSLIQALNIKLIEEIREKLSGVYGIGANASVSKNPYEHYSIRISFPCSPDNVDGLTEAVFAEIEKMKANGPTEKDLQKVKETQRQDMVTNLKENQYWLRGLEKAYFLGQDPTNLVNYESSIEGLTVEGLKETANKYFNTEQYVQVVLYPEKGEPSEETGQ